MTLLMALFHLAVPINQHYNARVIINVISTCVFTRQHVWSEKRCITEWFVSHLRWNSCFEVYLHLLDSCVFSCLEGQFSLCVLLCKNRNWIKGVLPSKSMSQQTKGMVGEKCVCVCVCTDHSKPEVLCVQCALSQVQKQEQNMHM